MLSFRNPIFCALDLRDLDKAADLAHELRDVIGGVKIGMEVFYAHGVDGYRRIAEAGLPIFLDLKLHDIPNTVAGAIRSLMPLEPALLTLHIAGGPGMIAAARQAAHDESAKPPLLVGVSVLTSLDDSDLNATGIEYPVADQVERLVKLAHNTHLDGVVCSPLEISRVRAATDNRFTLVVPGIRPAGTETGDQKRVMTPRDASEAGATILVIGRPIVQAGDPVEAAQMIAESLKQKSA